MPLRRIMLFILISYKTHTYTPFFKVKARGTDIYFTPTPLHNLSSPKWWGTAAANKAGGLTALTKNQTLAVQATDCHYND